LPYDSNQFSLLHKVYIKNFTLALEKELRPHGIFVQLVSPLFVRTKMNNFSTTITQAKRNIFIPSVEDYTRFAVFTLGKTKRTTGYWAHGIQVNTTFRIKKNNLF
jgi:17beta-estradiol 17-dehydrogenase / very-long-chain 3-oxoacyl-CoA reductase